MQELLASDPGYAERITGRPPGPRDGRDLLRLVPAGFSLENKHVLGLFDGDLLVAVVDLLRGYPDPDHAFVGLLQVRGDRQHEGLGRALHDQVVAGLSAWPEIARLRLAIVDTNADTATPFWTRLGYLPTGEAVPFHDEGHLPTTARLYERSVARD